MLIMKHLKLFILALALLPSLFLGAQTVRDDVSLRISHSDGIYAKGENVQVWADVKRVPEAALFLCKYKFCSKNAETKEPITLHEGENLVFEGSFDEPVHYIFEITDGVHPRVFKDEGKGNAHIGIVVAPEEFKVGFDTCEGREEFWAKELKVMRREKMKPSITNDKEEKGFRTYHVDINCVGPAPVRAYVSHPTDARKGSLPIIINLHAAGSPGGASLASVALQYAKCVEGGALAADINAHGMLDDQPKEYYVALNKGELKDYSGRVPELENYHFKWMMLRDIRLIDYLTKNPLWDGKHIILTGGSQGGYQSCFIAGLDPRISTIIVRVPAGLDQGATLQGRSASWPKTMYNYPEETKQFIPYFDPSVTLRNTKADIWCEIGLFDYTCPAANLFAVMNTVSSPKTIITCQRPHVGYIPGDHKELDRLRWEYFQKAATK